MKFTIVIKKHQIIRKNIYNFDEKKLIIEVGITVTYIIILEEIRSRKIIGANQNKNRKQVSLLATIYIITIKILHLFIY